MSCDTGTIQGSRLGPILYTIFVSPLFDLEKMTNYADDNFIIRSENNLFKLLDNIEKSKSPTYDVLLSKAVLLSIYKNIKLRLKTY